MPSPRPGSIGTIWADMDQIQTLEMEEVNGVIVSLTRMVRVFGLTQTDYKVLWESLSNTTPALPVFGDKLDPISPTDDSFSALVLVRRNVKLVDGEPDKCDVILKYEHILSGPNQELFNPTNGLILSKGKCSVREKSTNFFLPYGTPEGEPVPVGPLPVGNVGTGNPSQRTRIIVANQYPVEAAIEPELTGKYIEQVGEIKLPFPEGNVQFEGYLILRNPVEYAYSIIATINATIWLGQPELTWLCSEVSWQCLRPDTQLYKFGFEFQNNTDGWDPDVVFLDSRTNLPPSSVQQAVALDTLLPTVPAGTGAGVLRATQSPVTGLPIPAGAWKVPALRRVDFNKFFTAFFEGSPDVLFS